MLRNLRLASVLTPVFFSYSLSTFSIAFASEACDETFVAGVHSGAVAGDLQRPVRRYPVSENYRLHPESHIQFGFESEYSFSEIGKIVEYYRPADSKLKSPTEWNAMTLEDRTKWVVDHKKELFPTKREAGGLVLTEGKDVPKALPKNLIVDSTGNVEIVTPPMNTMEEWYSTVAWINDKFGVGSMQTTVSTASENFLRRPNRPTAQSTSVVKGFFNITQELSTWEKLDAGYERFKKDPTKPTVQSFNHPFLGPMSYMKQKTLNEYIEGNAINAKYGKEELEFVAGADNSFKYVGGTAYRPDIVGTRRTVAEVRDAHKNVEVLKERVTWTAFAMIQVPNLFARAESIKALDTVADFAKLPEKTQGMLKKLFTNKAHADEQYNAEEMIANDAFRNFAFPLRDVSGLLAFLEAGHLAGNCKKATDTYVQKLASIEVAFSSGKMTLPDAQAQVQGELAIWAHDTGIPQALKAWQTSKVFQSPEWKRFAASVPKEIVH